MNKVKSFLSANGFDLNSIQVDKYRTVGGKSFGNDGTYKIEVFKVIGFKQSFFLFHKITGKPLYCLGDTIDFNDIKEVFLTQQELVEYLKTNYINN